MSERWKSRGREQVHEGEPTIGSREASSIQRLGFGHLQMGIETPLTKTIEGSRPG